jgi:hypothetical protein
VTLAYASPAVTPLRDGVSREQAVALAISFLTGEIVVAAILARLQVYWLIAPELPGSRFWDAVDLMREMDAPLHFSRRVYFTSH